MSTEDEKKPVLVAVLGSERDERIQLALRALRQHEPIELVVVTRGDHREALRAALPDLNTGALRSDLIHVIEQHEYESAQPRELRDAASIITDEINLRAAKPLRYTAPAQPNWFKRALRKK